MALRQPPDVTEVRDWCQVSEVSVTDEQLSNVLIAEQEQQGEQCALPESPQGLIPHWAYQGLLRRCARELAARGVPLGVATEGDFGSSRLPSYDGEISRIEGPYRIVGVG